MLYYWVSLIFLITLGVITFLLAVYGLAKAGVFFTLIEEGKGIIVVRGESFSKVLLAYAGHRVEKSDGELEIVKKDPEHHGLLGFLEEQFGIYWVGLWPWYKIREYWFDWTQWHREEGKENEIWHRREKTSFFYAQTYPYAFELKGAETGGKDGSKEGGNVTVDVKGTIFVEIVFPVIAHLRNKDWFVQLMAVVLDHIRLFVGKREFDQLRSNDSSRVINDKGTELPEGLHEFSQHVLMLNARAPVGKLEDSILKVFGIRIVGAQIRSVELSEESKRLAAATTAVYEAEEAAKALRIEAQGKKDSSITIAEGQAQATTLVGTAEADVIRKKKVAEAEGLDALMGTVKKDRDLGKFIHQQNKLGEAGSAGSAVIYTDGKNQAPVIIQPHNHREQKENI